MKFKTNLKLENRKSSSYKNCFLCFTSRLFSFFKKITYFLLENIQHTIYVSLKTSTMHVFICVEVLTVHLVYLFIFNICCLWRKEIKMHYFRNVLYERQWNIFRLETSRLFLWKLSLKKFIPDKLSSFSLLQTKEFFLLSYHVCKA